MSAMSVLEIPGAKAPSCPYCGNNPVHHRFAYLDSICALFMLKCLRNQNTTLLRYTERLEDYLIRVLIVFFTLVRVASFRSNDAEPISDRSRVVWDEAVLRGMQIEQMYIFHKATEHFRVRTKKKWHYFMSIPIPPSRSKAERWIDSKYELKRFFEKADVRVARGGKARTHAAALHIFDSIQKPVIVKPEVGSRGRHSLTHITTREEFSDAFEIARTLCPSVIIEEHLVGSVYRATYVHGEIVGVLRGDPPRITGDGVSSIATLITQKNDTRHERQKTFVPTVSSLEFLSRQGYTPDALLEVGKTIDLTEKVGLSYGGYAVEEYTQAHPKLLTALTRAGDVLGVPLVGFDFIIEDITLDPDTVRWGIIEANSLPFIDLHHFPVEGEPINVAAKVWDMWDATKAA